MLKQVENFDVRKTRNGSCTVVYKGCEIMTGGGYMQSDPDQQVCVRIPAQRANEEAKHRYCGSLPAAIAIVDWAVDPVDFAAKMASEILASFDEIDFFAKLHVRSVIFHQSNGRLSLDESTEIIDAVLDEQGKNV